MIMFLLCRCRSAWSRRRHWSDRSNRTTRTCWTQWNHGIHWTPGPTFPRWIHRTAWRYGLYRCHRISRYTLLVSHVVTHIPVHVYHGPKRPILFPGKLSNRDRLKGFWYNMSREYSAPEHYPIVHLYRQPERCRKSVIYNAFVLVWKLPYLSILCWMC